VATGVPRQSRFKYGRFTATTAFVGRSVPNAREALGREEE
jgi:hypothetical protein